MSKKKISKKKSIKKKSIKKAEKKMTPFGFDDNKPKIKEDKVSDTTYDPVVIKEPLFSNEEKLGMITSVLKNRMNPRDLNDAVREIKTILES